MDIVFLIGVFFLPFENFWFAPSAGWAAITPIIWFVYVLFNIKSLPKILYKYRKASFVLFIIFLSSFINYLYFDVALKNIINALISLTLGIIVLISLDIFFIQKKHKFSELVNLLVISYSITIFIGFVQFFCYKNDIVFLENIFFMIFKRIQYINIGRVQFFFTEPSFIGMHLFGILLPIYLLTKKKKLLILIFVYSFCAILFNCGVRILLDIFAVLIIMIGFKNVKLKNLLVIITLVPILIFSFNFMYENNSRIRGIVDNGINADGSLASRYFRINASIIGYIKDPIHALFGYGIGDSIIPLRMGYSEARQQYNNRYMKEVLELNDENYVNDSVSYCLYTRMISEFGLIIFALFLYYLISLNNKIDKNNIFRQYVWVLLYLYIQFESYIFYSIWLYIVMCNKIFIEKEKGRSNEIL